MTNMYRVRATLTFSGGSPGLFTSYHRVTSTISTAEAQAASDRVRGAWDVVKTILPTSFIVSMQPGVDVINDEDGQLMGTKAITPLGNVTGTAAGAAGPPQVMAGLVLSTGTIVNGRRLRGRINVGPLAASAVSTTAPAAGIVTAVNAFGVALVTVAPPSATAPLVVWHRPKFSPSGDLEALGSSSYVLSSVCSPKWFTLRSRLN